MPQLKKQSTVESFSVIREEQMTPPESIGHIKDLPQLEIENLVISSMEGKNPYALNVEAVIEIVKKIEETLRLEFQKILNNETDHLKARFEEILQNEEVRASFMMCEAHRERQEKISALQTQLECKNLAGLMYVLCLERKKSKVEKLKIIGEYRNYIANLQDILKDSQEVILNLSRGYKTAARVDQEWRIKVEKIIKQFQHFVHNYMGGRPEVNQYFFDIPKALQIETSTEDDRTEDPIQDDNETVEEEFEPKAWWDTLDHESRPFVMYGDLGHLEHAEKKNVVKIARAEKTAPAYWKEYLFNGFPVTSECPNADIIKDKFLERIPVDKWECHTQSEESPPMIEGRRGTLRNMGSILKLITGTAVGQPTKTMLLGARDSMEIASTTKMRERRRQSLLSREKGDDEAAGPSQQEHIPEFDSIKLDRHSKDEGTLVAEDPIYNSNSLLGSIHNDSLQIIQTHKPDVDHKINYEKVCPVEDCRRMHVDSFVRTLPAYMRANPFEIFDVTLPGYETCTPEQLAVLRERIERKQRRPAEPKPAPPHDEWSDIGVTVATQTTDEFDPCDCTDHLQESLSGNILYKIEELLPIKEVLNDIQETCFHNSKIQFNRFKVLGQDSDNSICLEEAKKDFKTSRIDDITQILKKHPSLCDLFQGNTSS